jgi:hypothetical protein
MEQMLVCTFELKGTDSVLGPDMLLKLDHTSKQQVYSCFLLNVKPDLYTMSVNLFNKTYMLDKLAFWGTKLFHSAENQCIEDG